MRHGSVYPSSFNFFVLLITLTTTGFSGLQAACIYSSPLDAVELEVGVMLTWSTLQETNNETFALQKSLDGVTFETEGIIRPTGNSNAEKHYRYLDTSTGQNKAFYRLVDIDKDGNYAFSKVVIFHRNSNNDLLISSMSSTLTERFFTLTLQSAFEKQVDYKILDKSNQIVRNGSASLLKGMNAISLDLSAMQEGKYKVLIVAGKEEEEVYVQKSLNGDAPKLNFALKQDP